MAVDGQLALADHGDQITTYPAAIVVDERPAVLFGESLLEPQPDVERYGAALRKPGKNNLGRQEIEHQLSNQKITYDQRVSLPNASQKNGLLAKEQL